MTKNPEWVMSLPVAAAHDSKDDMRWRAVFDERLTFPIDALPMSLRDYFKADENRFAVADC